MKMKMKTRIQQEVNEMAKYRSTVELTYVHVLDIEVPDDADLDDVFRKAQDQAREDIQLKDKEWDVVFCDDVRQVG